MKQAGIEVTNESELRERLAEAQRWRYAFTTLAANGRAIGIRFEDRTAGSNEEQIRQTFAQFQFPERAEATFAASLKTEH
ncbi:MAG TPA: hypothetical protein VJ576_06190 [Rhodocyclaceae bacterium]|nr:hypothetical protein [Rhodocyclaceae bacterium]